MGWFNRRFCQRPRPSPPHRRPLTARLAVESLEERRVPTVFYYGGNVLPHVQAQALFLGSNWSTVPADAAATKSIDSFLTSVTGGPYMDALTRAGYGVGRGSASPGAVDTVNLPTNSTITDASIQAKIQGDIVNGWLEAPDPNRLYVVYVEPNVAVDLGGREGTTQQGILGYHGAFSGQDAAGNRAVIRYAVIAYPGGTVRNSSMGTTAIDQLTAVTSHELAEAATDPDVNYGRLGWYDPQRGEIADISEANPYALVRLNGFLVQEVVDRNDRLLPITSNSNPATPTSPATTPTVLGTTTTLTASPTRYPRRRVGYPIVTLTITISADSSSAVPDGMVSLLYNGSVIGTAAIHTVNGVATAQFNVQFFARGNYSFSAHYLGSTMFQQSSSDDVTVTI